ncbi:MAG: nucleotidyltransferase family protein [Gemmatimonadota bacterium]|nr:nucleotidyltransferase family protein [Gemmatimonadota bacterium]
MIAGLLLSAGRSTRFGADKLCAKLNGKAVVRLSVRVLAPLDVVYVVIPPSADLVTQALSRLDVRFVVNLWRDEGIASSIRAGVAALPDEAEAVVIALGDQPLASSAVTKALCSRWIMGDVSAVAAEYRDGSGHPVLFGRECFTDLARLEGDVGGRSILRALGERAAYISIDSDAPLDIDTPEALADLERSLLVQ